MADIYYPPLDEKNLNAVMQLVDDKPDFLDNPLCPYSEKTKMLLRGEMAHLDFATPVVVKSLNDNDIMEEINEIHQKLKDYWDEVKDSDKSADKNTFFRVSVSLLERIVASREKMSNIKNVNSFMEEVLTILGEICTADQRNEVFSRLERFKTQGS